MVNSKINKFLQQLKDELEEFPADLHITRKAGAFVAISDGKVLKIGEPDIRYCPLFSKLFNKENIDIKAIKEKFEWQISNYGMFTCHRHVADDKIVVPFGASEIVMYALNRKVIDCAVVVCEGAGTVISNNPALIQGIGAYMNGIFYTSPIKEVIERIKQSGGTVLDERTAKINQYQGVKKAIDLGFKKIAVTLRGDETRALKEIRNLDTLKTLPDVKVTVLSVCNSGISRRQAKNLRDNADLVWACGSKYVRETTGPAAIVQLGVKIPVFIMSNAGVELITGYSGDENFRSYFKDGSSKHYITSNKYHSGGIKTNMGKFFVYLYPVDKLPVITDDEPDPLI
jgi:putative methanogenesis marker protein 8